MNRSEDSLVRVPAWKEFPWLRHGFSTRWGGVSAVYAGKADAPGELNLGWTKEDDPVLVAENRRRFVAGAAGLDDTPVPLITLRQVHSASTLTLGEGADTDLALWISPEGRALREGDGLMTDATGILLGIQTADCVPVLVADTRLRVVAAFHAGWRGAAAGIVEHGIAGFIREYGASPDDLVAAIGPSIGSCCYTVGEEVRSEFGSRFSYADELFRESEQQIVGSRFQYRLDLWEANRLQLLGAGIEAKRISVVGECTGCFSLSQQRKYFSHRVEHGITGRMMSVIGVES